MTVTHLLDIALPYSAEDNRCGMKRQKKTERRMRLAMMLNDLRNGKSADLTKVDIMIDYPTFERNLEQWTESLRQS